MMKKTRNHSLGFSMVEVLACAAILALVIVGTVQTYQRTIGAHQQFQERAGARQTLFKALEHVLKVGRLSGTLLGTCSKSPSGTIGLECFVDFTVPHKGVATQVRFAIVPEGLAYQHYIGTSWVTKITYEGITDLTVCDDNDMATNTCKIEPRKLNQVYGTAPTFVKRYFRVRLTMGDKKDPKKTTNVQSAFFTRNPGFNGLSYEWVSQ